jgi:hypothetical protein
VICYDTDKSPIRMVRFAHSFTYTALTAPQEQRFGRVGRKRGGEIHLLLDESREKDHVSKAHDAYKKVQGAVVDGSTIKLFGDVPRLLPVHFEPKCLEIFVDIEPYVQDAKAKKAQSTGEAAMNVPQQNLHLDPAPSHPRAGLIWERPLSAIEKDMDAVLQGADSDEDPEAAGFAGPLRSLQSVKTMDDTNAKGARGKKPARMANHAAENMQAQKHPKSYGQDSEHIERPHCKPRRTYPSQPMSDDEDLSASLEYSSLVQGVPWKSIPGNLSHGYKSMLARAPDRRQLPLGREVIELLDTDDESPQPSLATAGLVNTESASYRKPLARAENSSWTSPLPPISPPLQGRSRNSGSSLNDDSGNESDTIQIVGSSQNVSRQSPPQNFQRWKIEGETIEISEIVHTGVTPRPSNTLSAPAAKQSQSLSSNRLVSRKRPHTGLTPSREPGNPTRIVQLAPASKRRRVIDTLSGSDE